MVKVRLENEIVVNGEENMKKLQNLNFVRPNKEFVILPYFDELSDELDILLQKSVNGFVTCMIAENTMDIVNYADLLYKYAHCFGLRMKKEMYLDLIKFCYESMVKKDQKPALIKFAATVVNKLLVSNRQFQFNRNHLCLDWKPLMQLYTDAVGEKIRDLSVGAVSDAIYMLSPFYAPEEQPNIWNRIQEYLSIGETMSRFAEYCVLFLTVEGMTKEEHLKYGCGIWFDRLWKMYLMAEMNSTWTHKLLEIFVKIAMVVPDAIDWSRYYNEIFTKLIRSFNLSIRDGKVAVGDGSESRGISFFANFASATIGGPNSCLPYFDRALKCIEHSIHPQNSGDHISQIVTFLENFTKCFNYRIRIERIKTVKRQIPKEYYLTDSDIDAVSKIVVDAIAMLLFSPDASYKSVSSIINDMAATNISMVGPKLLEHFYSSIFALSEPHRLSTTMDALVQIIFQIICDPKNDYRQKSDVKFSTQWIAKLEKERMSWPTYRKGSELKNLQNLKIDSLRHHAFYILEVFVNSIDINDVGRAEAALKTLVLVFSSIPVMDFSDATKYHAAEMTPDDLVLCELSKRLPAIVEQAFEKILQTVSCLAICAPLNSTKNMGTMNDTDMSDGEEERILKESIDECVSAIFSHSSPQLTEKLFDRLFDFVLKAEFESFAATDLLSGLVASCVWVSDKEWKKFAEFINKKLKTIFTEEVQKMKEPPASILYYAVLASSLFCCNSNMILENEQLMSEVIELLIKCESKTAYITGSKGLSYIFSTLAQIYPTCFNGPLAIMKKPINEWNPAKEWVRCYKLDNMKMLWHVPSKAEVEMIQRMANRFLFPDIELMGTNLEREEMKKVLLRITSVLSSLIVVLRNPESDPEKCESLPNFVPLPSSSVNGCNRIEWELLTPDGKNMREYLIEKVEKMMEGNMRTDSKIVESLLGIAIQLCGEQYFDMISCKTTEKLILMTYGFLAVPIYGERNRAVFEAMLTFGQYSHLNVQRFTSLYPFPTSKFDVRLFKCITSFALNEYELTRVTAQAHLSLNTTKISICRDHFIDLIADKLTNAGPKDEDVVKGCLSTIFALDWLISTSSRVREKLWTAILRMRIYDDPFIRAQFDKVIQYIADIPNDCMRNVSRPETYLIRNENVARVGAKLLGDSKLDEWKSFVTEEGIRRQYESFHGFRENIEKKRVELVTFLLDKFVNNGELHHTREKLARSMVYRCSREFADKRVIECLLSQLIHDEESQRFEAIDELKWFMRFNKPKTIKIEFQPPKKMESEKMECGIREDNTFLAYDSTNLPNTEEKWNNTIFVEKQKGSFQFPKVLHVRRKAKDGEPLETREMSDAEKAIAEWFEKYENVEKWVLWRCMEKEGRDSGMSATRAAMIKYTIRNFPNNPNILNNFINCMAKLLQSRKREDQLVAAELLCGICQGIKHYDFKKVEKFWKWAAPEIDRFLDVMNSEAKDDWDDAIRYILCSSNDYRRFWWLIERLMTSIERINIEEWRQAFRIELLLSQQWRYGEINNRLCKIAWNKLPTVVTDTLRTSISRVYCFSSLLDELNFENSYTNVDKRFQTVPVDIWIARFMDNIPQLQSPIYASSRTSLRSSKSQDTIKHSPIVDSPARRNVKSGGRKKRLSSLSPTAIEHESEKTIMIFFRTLLELLQYYYSFSYHSYTLSIVNLMPKLFEYANEEDYELSENDYKDVDITQNSSMIIHDYMSSLWLAPEFLNTVVQTLIQTFESNVYAWRVRLSIVKFVQVMVYSNIYTLRNEKLRRRIEKLVFDAIGDPSISVRREAAKCLLLLIHCEYIDISEEKMNDLESCLNNKKETSSSKKHGSALALSAYILAFPFNIPPRILRPLRILCRSSTRMAVIQTTITESLREFRRQHRDDWSKTKSILGADLSYEIENAIAPLYYA